MIYQICDAYHRILTWLGGYPGTIFFLYFNIPLYWYGTLLYFSIHLCWHTLTFGETWTTISAVSFFLTLVFYDNF